MGHQGDGHHEKTKGQKNFPKRHLIRVHDRPSGDTLTSLPFGIGIALGYDRLLPFFF